MNAGSQERNVSAPGNFVILFACEILPRKFPHGESAGRTGAEDRVKREDQVINRMLQEAPGSAGQRGLLLALWFALGAALGALGKWVHDRQIYTAGSDFGYYLGLLGGLLMLSLLLYPLRKRQVLFGERCGRMQHWFRFHVCAGICGPLLVLFHSTFRSSSLNAAAALYAMLLVVLSGIIGRFI